MTKKLKKRVLIFTILTLLGVVIAFSILGRFQNKSSITLTKPSEESFSAPGKNWHSPKKVEDYFVEHLHMTPQEAIEARSLSKGNDGKISLRLTQGTTTAALLSNLEYYGFVKDQKALEYALTTSTDSLTGRTYTLKFGNNTVDLYASYRISEDMTAWEIADQLLNHPSYFAYDEYGYMFMP